MNEQIKPENAKEATKAMTKATDEMTESDIIAELFDELEKAKERADFFRTRLEQREEECLLSELQALNPSINSIDEMGADFAHMLEAGVSVASAYRVITQKANEKKSPPIMGDFYGERSGKSDFFTFDEVNAMSKEQIEKNYDKIMKSQGKWKKKHINRN